MKTGVPSGTRLMRARRSASLARRQPAEVGRPIEEGSSVIVEVRVERVVSWGLDG